MFPCIHNRGNIFVLSLVDWFITALLPERRELKKPKIPFILSEKITPKGEKNGR
jgi:hypothetical protein